MEILVGILVVLLIIAGLAAVKSSGRDRALELEEQENRKTPGNQKITPTG